MPPFQYKTIKNKAVKEELNSRLQRWEAEHQANSRNVALYKTIGDSLIDEGKIDEAEAQYAQARQARENVRQNEAAILAARAEYDSIKDAPDTAASPVMDVESVVIPEKPEPEEEKDDELDDKSEEVTV